MSKNTDQSIQIRLMIERDAEPIARVLNHSIKHSISHFGTVPTNPDEIIEDWKNSGEYYPWIIACDHEGTFLGFAKGSQWRARQAYRWVVETGVYVAECAQGRGIGKILYTKLFELFRAQGYRHVVSGVSIPNIASEKLHESMGMTLVGEFAPAGYKLGQWINVRWYQRALIVQREDDDWDCSQTPPTPIRAFTSVWDEIHPS